MDPVAYTKYSRVTNVLAKQFVDEIANTSGWRDARLRLVMDIGCGNGNASTYWIDHYFPNIDRLIGVDIDPEMIRLAKQQNKKENFEFYVADIMDSDSLKAWKCSVSRIFSHFVLHRVQDQKSAFSNIFDLLEPTGEACLHFVVKCPYYSSSKDLLKTTKWKPIFEVNNVRVHSKRLSIQIANQVIPESNIKNYDTSYYKQMFEDVGFRVKVCATKPLGFAFKSDEECKNLLVSFHSIGNMSDEMKEDYKNDLFEQFLKHCPRNSEGRPTYKNSVLLAKLYKG